MCQPNGWAVKESTCTLQKLFPLRTCNDSAFANCTRTCLLHQINLYAAPCVGKITKENCAAGAYDDLTDTLAARMVEAAAKQGYE